MRTGKLYYDGANLNAVLSQARPGDMGFDVVHLNLHSIIYRLHYGRFLPFYDLPFDRHCKHEFVLSGRRQKKLGVRTLDIAKRLLDFGYHPPTIYFPLNVEECIMIEPTETESKETLDGFIDKMIQIAKEVEENPEVVQEAPHTTVIKRLDETMAARKPILLILLFPVTLYAAHMFLSA